jgi:ParB/RepB/Spo0J family partition protein
MTTAAFNDALPVDQLHESKWNPRRTFDPAKLEELVASVKAKGVVTPLLVRPNASGFEIGAGHRRYRAAKAAGVATVPALIRPMSDEEFLELVVFENDEREDVHPLEEAAGYKTMLTELKWDVGRIAARTGKSERYVYDRVKLLQLIPEAQKLFLANTITAGHAILLARLKPEDQKRIVAIDREVSDEGVLLKRDAVLLTDDEEDKLDELADRGKAAYPLTPISVRELERYIAEHVRFKPTETDAFLFPDTASDSALLEFVRDHPLTFRLDKVDQTWFMDLITSGGLIRKALADERELETA